VAQRSDGSGTSFCGVMTVRHSLRRGCLHNIRARAPGSTSSCTTARLPSYVTPFSFFPQTKLNSAITQSRTAARKELLDQHKSPDECERLYEESLWCLYALQDDLLQKGNPFVDEDRETIATCACPLTLLGCFAG
jgi:hypothetical protein